MDANLSHREKRRNGTIEIIEVPPRLWANCPGREACHKEELYLWTPPYQIEVDLPRQFWPCLLCMHGTDGVRRLAPVGQDLMAAFPDIPSLIHSATSVNLAYCSSLAGHAILADRGEIQEDLPLSYDESRLICRYIAHRSEYFSTPRKLHRDFSVKSESRVDSSTILPLDLGVAPGADKPWGIERLLEEGRNAARAIGRRRPKSEDIFGLGILEAARAAHMTFTANEAEKIVQLASLDLMRFFGTVTEEEWAYVTGEVRRSLWDHLSDTREQFEEWVRDPRSNLLHRICKRKDCLMSRAQVRNALLQLGWQAIKMQGDCIRAMMITFRNAMPEPLSASERRQFDHIYVGDPQLGGVPLVMLTTLLPFIAPAVLRMWEDPEDNHAPHYVVTMMWYFAQLMSTRRDTDRRYKRLRKQSVEY